MKFLLDENIGLRIVGFLTSLGRTTTHIQNIKIGLEDYKILNLSVLKDSIIITFDKDFGELIFKNRKKHNGVIFLRLENQKSENVIKALQEVFLKIDQIEKSFIVVTEKDNQFSIRTKKMPEEN